MTSLRAARPRIITAFALLLIVGALVALPNNVFIGGRLFMAGEVSLARLSWSVVSKLGMVACGLGFLRMRKWAPFLYFGLVAATFASTHLLPPSRQALEWYSRPWVMVMSLAVPAAAAMIVVKYRRLFS